MTTTAPNLTRALLDDERLIRQRWRCLTSALPVCKSGPQMATRLVDEGLSATAYLAATTLIATVVGAEVEFSGAGWKTVYRREE